MNSIPSTWTQLRAAAQAALDEDRHELERNARNARRLLDRPASVLAGLFGSPVDALARILPTSGDLIAREHVLVPAELLPRLLRHGDETAERAPASALSVISYVTLARCLDVSLPAEVAGLEARWLPLIARRPELRHEHTRRTAALAAVAVGVTELVPVLDGGAPLQPRASSRDIAGPNVAGFTRHLAEVLAGGGGAEAIEGPWRSFLAAFPLTLAADGVRWIDLVWAALAIMVRFENRPPAAVGTYLPVLVAELAR